MIAPVVAAGTALGLTVSAFVLAALTAHRHRQESNTMPTEPTCSWCRRPLRGPEGCDRGLPHAYLVGTEADEMTRTLGDRCSDCGAPRLEQHHAGCLHAWCRRCDRQAVFCDPDECEPR